MAGDADREEDVTSELPESFVWPVDDDGRGELFIDPETDSVLEPGTLLNDRFEIVELVHSGGMGHVYKAIDRRRHPEGSGQIHVAIKMLRESLANRDEFRMTLEREAARAQSLSHSNIINIFDFDEHEGRFFLVMEWLEGESVRALLQRTNGQRLAPTLAWLVIEGAATALRHAHLNNVVHADINPSNIFITTTLEIKLLDFGVARCADDLGNPPMSGATWATQTYASPEALSGLPPALQDDVFSLGCVAYRLLGGEHPFGGSSSIEARDRGVTIEPITGVPENEWEIISRALAYSRSERPAAIDVFLRGQHGATARRVSAGKPKRSDAFSRWGPPVAAAVAAAIVVGWWLRPDDAMTDAESDDVQIVPPAEAPDQTDAPFVEALLDSAKQAADDQRLVLPEGENAREYYRDVLIADPENREALRGLRSISDAFVERASIAFKSGDPRAAASALTIASDTDSGNPAISIISELLIAQGDAQLTAARVAAATGDIDQATSALAQAETYAHIDPSEINAVRDQIAGLELRTAFLNGLAVVDSHIAAGRLLEPAGRNARESLATLSNQYSGEPRLTAAYERLAERLLTRAVFATAAGRVAEAEALIDAADSLGVLEAEVDLARESLAGTIASAVRVPESVTADEASDHSDSTADVSEAQVDAVTEPDALGSPVQEPLTQASAAGQMQSGPEDTAADGGEVTSGESGRSAAMSLEDLGLERFIAPTYPRRAERRGLSGYVEVAFNINSDGRTDAIEILGGSNAEIFGTSAANAVRKWRFAPRPDTIREAVILRFQLAD